jgi:hypothetical protein
MEDIEHYSIPVYNFPYDVEEDDEETIQDNSELRVSLRPCRFVHEILILSGYDALRYHRFGRGSRGERPAC